MPAFIHPLAHVDDTVSLGEGTKVWQFASIVRGTVIGVDSVVWPHVMLDGSLYGDRVRIGSGFAAGPGFRVGNDVFIGPNVTFCNDVWPFIDPDGRDDAALRSGKRFSVIVEDGAVIGSNAVLLPGVRVGKGAVVAAGAVVERSVAPGTVLRRNGYISPRLPANWREKRMRWACS